MIKTTSFINTLLLKKVLAESSWVFIGQVGSIFSQLLLIKFITDLIPVDEYGTFSILLVFALLVERTIMTIQAGITRHYCEAYELDQLSAYWAASTNLLLKPTLITAILGASLASVFLIIGRYNFFFYSLIITPFTIFMGWNTALSGINLAARRRRIHSLAQLAEPLLRLIALVCLTTFYSPSVDILIIAYLIFP